MILEHLDVSGGRVFFAKALDELDFGVHAVVMVNEAADKANDDNGWSGGTACRGSSRLWTRRTGDEEQRKSQKPKPERRKHLLHRECETTSGEMSYTRLKLLKIEREKMVRRGGKE
jgi:hypothetical protein